MLMPPSRTALNESFESAPRIDVAPYACAVPRRKVNHRPQAKAHACRRGRIGAAGHVIASKVVRGNRTAFASDTQVTAAEEPPHSHAPCDGRMTSSGRSPGLRV